MILALLLLASAQQAPAPARVTPPEVTKTPAVPADWADLAPLPYRRRPDWAPSFAEFVAGEVKAQRCTAQRDSNGHVAVSISLAVLVSPAGGVKRIVPQAIGCPTVEQYAVGLLGTLARDNLDTGTATADAWYKTSMTFAWVG